MLAKSAKPFDGDARWLFEVKWDGTRTVAYVENRTLRLMNRRRRDTAGRYPDLAFLADALPDGTVLDGEIVVLRGGGKPDFRALLSREQAESPNAIRDAARGMPATYVVFDQLYDRHVDVHRLTCEARRAILRRTVAAVADPRLIMSEGVAGGAGRGVAYFRNACAEGLEGVIGKRLDSRYEPGRRSGAWVKIKRQELVHCAVIGFVPEGDDDFGSLILAAHDERGTLRCVGRVGTGFDAALRKRMNTFLWSNLRDRPLVDCRERGGRWVDAGLYCTVKCMERTATGHLRAPAFGRLYEQQQQ